LTDREQARLWAGGTRNIEAWECVVRGSEMAHRHVRDDNRQAQILAERAMSLDSNYADAWALYALTYFEDAMWGWSHPKEAILSKAENAADKAIELEALSPDGFIVLSCVKYEQGSFNEAVDLGRKAISLAPNHAPNLALFAAALGRAGEYRECLMQVRRAIRLSPIYPAWYLHIVGSASFALEEYDEAVDAYRNCVDATDPDSAFMPQMRMWLAICLAAAGHEAEARHLRDHIMKSDPDFGIDDWWQTPKKDYAVRNRGVEIWNNISA